MSGKAEVLLPPRPRPRHPFGEQRPPYPRAILQPPGSPASRTSRTPSSHCSLTPRSGGRSRSAGRCTTSARGAIPAPRWRSTSPRRTHPTPAASRAERRARGPVGTDGPDRRLAGLHHRQGRELAQAAGPQPRLPGDAEAAPRAAPAPEVPAARARPGAGRDATGQSAGGGARRGGGAADLRSCSWACSHYSGAIAILIGSPVA